MTALTTVVLPTVGRASLGVLLESLAKQDHAVDSPVLVVDDRPDPDLSPLRAEELEPTGTLALQVLRSGGRGPAGARNLGWRHARTPWVTFLDDDVVTPPDWYDCLLADLDAAEAAGQIGSQARIVVPLPEGRRPTDDERATIGLATAAWVTADMSYRRQELVRVGGFDERFPRAFREDADIALRLGADRGRVAQGLRHTVHPVKHGDFWFSVSQQKGNADDRLMRRLHGSGWRARARARLGRLPRHAAITAAGAVAVAAAAVRAQALTRVAALVWATGTAELAWRRVADGPRTAAEVRRMLVTSAVIPPVATWHALAGAVRHRASRPWRGAPDLVLVDRDGTIVHDVPYNGDPERVSPVDGAKQALDRLRAEGVRVALVTNQSGIGSGRITAEEAVAVNNRVEELLGPFDGVYLCPHDPEARCACRKPAPGLVEKACHDLGTPPARCVLVGDIASDLDAADAAGARAILVPTPQTRPEEVAAARRDGRLEPELAGAVDRILGGPW
jgi:histidinol-phosphate phosphatase family protein